MDGRDIPTRKYPSYKIKNGKRYVLKRGEFVSFSERYSYNQYLITILIPSVLGFEVFSDSSNSRYQRMIKEHLLRMARDPIGEPVLATNADVLVLQTATDLEVLYLNDLLPNHILKRLKSGNDEEIRGVLFEISVAAACYRCGYKINWLTEDGSPEFEAIRHDRFHIEAKRRDRSKAKKFDINAEIRAYRQRFNGALKKAKDLPLLIFLDSDLPPKDSRANEDLYVACDEAFGGNILGKNALIVTHSGYEYDARTASDGSTSAMIIRGNEAPHSSTINEIVLQLCARPANSDGSDWDHK